MIIDDELMLRLEAVSQIRLSSREREEARAQLGDIVRYLDKLSELEPDGGEAQLPAEAQALREDAVRPSLPAEEVLEVAPRHRDGFFVVPKTVE